MARKKLIRISEHDLIDILFYARRYCDRRATYAPSEFNRIYENIRSANPGFLDKYDSPKDRTLMDDGRFWPHAQDGWFKDGRCDARPTNARKVYMNYARYICSECAVEEGGTWPECNCATMHSSFCDLCKEQKMLAAVGDWDWPRNHPFALQRWNRD